MAGLNNKGVGSNVSAVAATNTNGFINPNGLITEFTSEQRLTTIGDSTGLSRSGERLGRICGV